MLRTVLLLISALALTGCFVLVPIPVPLRVSDLSRVTSVPMRSAPAGSSAAVIGAVVNQDRAAQGLVPLAHNPTIDRAAQGHAEDMDRNGFFDHKGSNGSSPRTRLRATGYGACRTAENIGDGYRSAAAAARGWQGSPPHQSNNLDPKILEYGVGHAPASHKWVLLLAQPGC